MVFYPNIQLWLTDVPIQKRKRKEKKDIKIFSHMLETLRAH
jgi:hypothetical protein